jgi:hypothetical protein
LLICPFFAEKEPGFYKWLVNIFRTASQLSTGIQLYSSPDTELSIRDFIGLNKVAVTIEYRGQIDLGDIAQLISKVQPYDMVVLVSSREGGISYTPVLDILPKKMAKYFENNSLVFIYPATASDSIISNYEQEISGGLLGKGLNMFRNAKNIFRKRVD